MPRRWHSRLAAVERRHATVVPYISIRLTHMDYATGQASRPWETDPELDRAYQRRDALDAAALRIARQHDMPLVDYVRSVKHCTYAWLAELALADPAFLPVARRYCEPGDWPDDNQ